MAKHEYYVKTLLSSLLIIYIIIQNFTLYRKIIDKSFAASIEKAPKTTDKLDYAITGGSNALMGLSSLQISESMHVKSYNLAISAAEGAGILNYAEWLKSTNISAETVIYSSMNFWYLTKDAPFDWLQSAEHKKLISTPLIQTLHQFIQKPSFDINTYGDLTAHSCNHLIKPLPEKYATKENIETDRLIKFIETAGKIKTALSAQKFFIRIPPIYISAEHSYTFKEYLNHISLALEKNDITVIGKDSAITTNHSMMCIGSNHPTPQGRTEHTKTLIRDILAN